MIGSVRTSTTAITRVNTEVYRAGNNASLCAIAGNNYKDRVWIALDSARKLEAEIKTGQASLQDYKNPGWNNLLESKWALQRNLEKLDVLLSSSASDFDYAAYKKEWCECLCNYSQLCRHLKETGAEVKKINFKPSEDLLRPKPEESLHQIVEEARKFGSVILRLGPRPVHYFGAMDVVANTTPVKSSAVQPALLVQLINSFATYPKNAAPVIKKNDTSIKSSAIDQTALVKLEQHPATSERAPGITPMEEERVEQVEEVINNQQERATGVEQIIEENENLDEQAAASETRAAIPEEPNQHPRLANQKPKSKLLPTQGMDDLGLTDLRELRSKLNSLNEEREKLMQTVQELKESNQARREEVEASQNRVNELDIATNRITLLEEEKKVLKQQVSDCEKNEQKFRLELVSARCESEECKEKILLLEIEIRALNTRLEKTIKNREEIIQKNNELHREEIDSLERDKKTLEKQVSKLAKEEREHEAELVSVRDEEETLKQRILLLDKALLKFRSALNSANEHKMTQGILLSEQKLQADEMEILKKVLQERDNELNIANERAKILETKQRELERELAYFTENEERLRAELASAQNREEQEVGQASSKDTKTGSDEIRELSNKLDVLSETIASLVTGLNEQTFNQRPADGDVESFQIVVREVPSQKQSERIGGLEVRENALTEENSLLRRNLSALQQPEERPKQASGLLPTIRRFIPSERRDVNKSKGKESA